jgi:hypothetical protein
MDVQPVGTQIHITLEGDEAFDLLQALRSLEGPYRRTAEALCARLWALIGPPATGAMERQALGYVKHENVPRDT